MAWAGRVLSTIWGRIGHYLSMNKFLKAAVALDRDKSEQRVIAAKQEQEQAHAAWVAADEKAREQWGGVYHLLRRRRYTNSTVPTLRQKKKRRKWPRNRNGTRLMRVSR